jgi:pectate lyase
MGFLMINYQSFFEKSYGRIRRHDLMKLNKKYRSLLMLTILFLTLSLVLIGCGGSKRHHSSNGNNSDGSDTATSVSLVLNKGSLLDDRFTNTDNWEFVNGATGSVSNGVLTVNADSTQGIAMRLKDDVWMRMNSPSSYYVEMYLKPLSSANSWYKIFGVASNIDSTCSKWYWAGLSNRVQIGYYDSASSDNTNNLKKRYDKSSGYSNSDLVYYKIRYEYDNGTIGLYVNDIPMPQTYDPGQGFSGTIGVVTSNASFEVKAVAIGKLGENADKLMLAPDDTSSLSLAYSKYVRFINNTSSKEIRVGDEVALKVTATDSTGLPGTWTAMSTNSNVLAVSASSGSDGETLTFKGTGVGTATVIVANGNDKRAITYTVLGALTYVNDNYGIITNLVYPAVGANNAYPDGEIAIKFDSMPRIASTTATSAILIYNYATGALADTIYLEQDKYVISGRGQTAVNCGSQRIRIDGDYLYIAPHNGKLSYGTHYYVAIVNGVFAGTLNGKTFTGFSPDNKSWNFTTKSEPVISGKTITVDGGQNSTADFRTVQAALDWVTAKSIDGAEIQIQPGTYYELLTFTKNLNLTLRGMGSGKYGNDVIIRYTNGNEINFTAMEYRCLAYITSDKNVNLANITLYNTGIKSEVGQAETIFFRHPGNLIARNCSFKSQQDTICSEGYNWFYNCHVEGNTDFIWGGALVSLFEKCEIYCISNGSYIFQARQKHENDRGYVLYNCTIKTNSGETSYFARSGGPFDNVSIINCTLTGTGTIDSWSGAPKPDPNPNKATVGWKQYGLKDSSGKAVAVTTSTSHTLTDAEYNTYWSSQAKILGSWSPSLP